MILQVGEIGVSPPPSALPFRAAVGFRDDDGECIFRRSPPSLLSLSCNSCVFAPPTLKLWAYASEIIHSFEMTFDLPFKT